LEYLGFDFTVKPALPGTDILIAELADAGFESFEETDTGCKAWIPARSFDQQSFDAIPLLMDNAYSIEYKVEMIAHRNWNAEWESGFDPVVVDNCIIRAPFHEAVSGYEYEVVILPQMSFGTGHHETTSLMVGKLLTMNLQGLAALDMGCGTGVLAILAAMKGAGPIWAVDNNANACENTLENCILNKIPDITVKNGDAAVLQENQFHVIFANINRNILLADMHTYFSALKPGGRILISGFFETDIPELSAACVKLGLNETDRKQKNEWALLEYTK